MDTKKRKPSKFFMAWIIMAAAIVLLNLAACFKGFCNGYKAVVYPLISGFWGVIFGVIPVAVGELLMYLGAIMLLFAVVLLPLLFLLRKKPGFRRFSVGYYKTLFLVIEGVLLIYTFHWIIPFRSDLLEVEGGVERTYTLKEIQNVRNHLVGCLNEAVQAVERDETGRVIYHENVVQSVFQSMKNLRGVYPILDGYYPPMKAALCSDFLDWMNIGGYTYPYTMEVTYNIYVNDLYYPFLLAHEASHHKGFYQENEANYIAFLACTQSEDPLVRYAGYNEIYNYINDAYLDTLFGVMDADAALQEYRTQPHVNEMVRRDREDAWEASAEKYEAANHPAQSFAPVAAEVSDVGWSVQGELLKENCYDGVVKMVLQYYDAKMGGLSESF